MTPGARIAAAAEILDACLQGTPAEKALTTWARRNRFAGSGDRAAIRDHVFDAIRCRRSAAAMGGADTGRGLVIGLLRLQGQAPEDILTGEGYSLPPLGPDEMPADRALGEAEALDIPDWLLPELRDSLGERLAAAMEAQRLRAPVFLRVNTARTSRQDATAALAAEGIETRLVPNVDSALAVTSGARRIKHCSVYRDGLVELQDASSQAVSSMIPLPVEGPVLDFCAGGGGKALALAARSGADVFAHDGNPARMKDIPERALRAGSRINVLRTADLRTNAPYGLVVTDVPCSGSGAWRRQPEAKWRLTRDKLDELLQVQRKILLEAAELCAADGTLAYVTCSLMRSENEAQIDRFLQERQAWRLDFCHSILPDTEGDGFFLAVLKNVG